MTTIENSYVSTMREKCKLLVGCQLMGVMYAPVSNDRSRYHSISGNPILIYRDLAKDKNNMFFAILQNEWQGYIGAQQWENIEDLAHLAPAIINKVEVISEGKLPGSISLFDQCELKFELKIEQETIEVFITPYAWENRYPIQDLDIHPLSELSEVLCKC